MQRLFKLTLLMLVMTAQHVCAQKIKVVDKAGEPVPYASILTDDAKFIGYTNLDGELSDVKGADRINITHIAYKTKAVETRSLPNGLVTLDDAEFNLGEVTVKPRPFVYIQTYYRLYYYSEKDGIVYYRAGLTDNTYDTVKKEMTSKTKHIAKAEMGILKVLLGAIIGSKVDENSHISTNTMEQRLLKRGEAAKLKITEVAPGKKLITDFKGNIGVITDNRSTHQRRYSMDAWAIYLHKIEAEGKTKKLGKVEERQEHKKNKVENDFFVYRIDEDGNYRPEDFVMSQYLTSYDSEEKDGSTDHVIVAVQVFTTERAYVDKNELNELKQKNKMKLTYDNIMRFEKDHDIPPIAPVVQKKLDDIWKKDKTD